MIETKKDEIRYKTLDPKRLLNRYLVNSITKKWYEDFSDEDTGELVSIERSELLFDRGTLIDQDTLAKIRFSIEAGEITDDIEVSNQLRMAFERPNETMFPYIVQAEIGDKKQKFLLYATSLDMALLVAKDFIELNCDDGFTIIMAKEFDDCIILLDNLAEYKANKLDNSSDADNEEDECEKAERKNELKKFYQIESRIIHQSTGEHFYTFLVHTFNGNRAMLLINNYLKEKEEERVFEARTNGNAYEIEEIHAGVETSKIVPIGRFIPREFSEAYL